MWHRSFVHHVRLRYALRLGVCMLLGSGCGESDTDSSTMVQGAAQGPTWHKDIAPLVMHKCGGCHEPDGIAPFSLHSYDTAAAFAPAIAQAVMDGRMPPFLAQESDSCAPRLPWQDDLRLSADEKSLIVAWAEGGAPAGDAAAAATIEPPATQSLPRRDLTLRLPGEIVVEGAEDIHRCVVVDPGLDRDTYVQGRLLTSGNSRVLHHVVSYILLPGENGEGQPRSKAELVAELKREKGVEVGGSYDCFGGPAFEHLEVEMLDAWAPGSTANLAPPNSAQPLSKDALVVLDMHYHPTGAVERDSETSLSLMLTDDLPPFISRIILLGNFDERYEHPYGVGDLLPQPGESEKTFVIPAGASQHVEEMTWTWNLLDPKYGEVTLSVYSAGTHMHYVGTDMQVHVEHGAEAEGGGARECLIQTPAWDFNWQRLYVYDGAMEALPTLQSGDVIHMRCVYDNTLENRFVREALAGRGLQEPVDVPLGEDTLDEMCVLALGIMHLNPAAF